MINVILCGGSGTRLWPISRKLMPKQFVKLFNNKSLFQLTVERNSKICDKQFIISNLDQYFLAIDQLEEINKDNNQYLLEPLPKNTAPAVALACFALKEDDLVFVTPSDHLIKNEIEYKKVLQKAKELALQDNLVTFGITPTFPEIGFGYIEVNGELNNKNGELNGLDVITFHEKPDIKTAKKYLGENNNSNSKFFLWNSGMFLFKAGVFLEELKKYSPEIYETSKIAFEHKKIINDNQFRIVEKFMSNIPENSIDYAVMEKSKKVKVVPSNIDWSDVGSFDALIKECEVPTAENYEEDSKNNFYYSNNKKKVIATIGLENFIVIDTNDALLITKKGKSQKVKNIVNKLKTTNKELLITPSSCLLYTSPSPRDGLLSRMPSSA
jgi:mannose-1-phosphate guanylyltransferase